MVSVLTVPGLCRRVVQHETLKPMPRALSDAIAQLSVPLDLSSTAPGAVALRATGGCMTYLKRCLIDHALVSLALFFSYHPAEITSGDASSAGAGSAAVAASPSVGGTLPGPHCGRRAFAVAHVLSGGITGLVARPRSSLYAHCVVLIAAGSCDGTRAL